MCEMQVFIYKVLRRTENLGKGNTVLVCSWRCNGLILHAEREYAGVQAGWTMSKPLNFQLVLSSADNCKAEVF